METARVKRAITTADRSQSLLSTVISRALTFSALGKTSSSTPDLRLATALSSCTLTGSTIVRWNEPYARSTR